jgi:hypothetical protein
MGARGRAWVEQHRTYARIADDVERVCLDLIGRNVADPADGAVRRAAPADRP